MLNAKILLEHRGYREREFQTCPEDHPLIAQFCGNDPQIILKAARLVQDQVEAIDLNLGCPQNIAKKGHYGSYLQEEWSLIQDIISTLHHGLDVPLTVKIRIFDDVQRTIKYAQMIESAGAQLITVHGRTREQRGTVTGLADWEQIKLVKESLSIPVFANGNILFSDDIKRCMKVTGVDGIMTAEGNLYNPAIFEPECLKIWQIVDEYLDIVRDEAPSAISAVRGHLFKLYRPCLSTFTGHREQFGAARSFEELSQIAADLNHHLRQKYNASPIDAPLNHSSTGTFASEFFCRSHIRDTTLFSSIYPLERAIGGALGERPTKISKIEAS
jgi:tRNA-dihydrouridine synthase 1